MHHTKASNYCHLNSNAYVYYIASKQTKHACSWVLGVPVYMFSGNEMNESFTYRFDHNKTELLFTMGGGGVGRVFDFVFFMEETLY